MLSKPQCRATPVTARQKNPHSFTGLVRPSPFNAKGKEGIPQTKCKALVFCSLPLCRAHPTGHPSIEGAWPNKSHETVRIFLSRGDRCYSSGVAHRIAASSVKMRHRTSSHAGRGRYSLNRHQCLATLTVFSAVSVAAVPGFHEPGLSSLYR